MRPSSRAFRPAAFAPSFLLAFAAAFAAFTLLPHLWRLGLAGVLRAPVLGVVAGWWALSASVGGGAALAAAVRALRRRGDRLRRHAEELPRGGLIPGALAGVIAGLGQVFAIGANVNSLVLSAIYVLGLRRAVDLGPAFGEATSWLSILAVGLLAGTAAVALLYFPWTVAGRPDGGVVVGVAPPNEALPMPSAREPSWRTPVDRLAGPLPAGEPRRLRGRRAHHAHLHVLSGTGRGRPGERPKPTRTRGGIPATAARHQPAELMRQTFARPSPARATEVPVFSRLTVILRLAVLGPLAACSSDDDVRGASRPSADGGTYLIVADDNGGKCGPLLVDGAVWRHRVDEPGPVRPGRHVIECGSDMAVQVDSGHTYRFDYWGP